MSVNAQTGVNIISNPSFETNLAGWSLSYQNAAEAMLDSVQQTDFTGTCLKATVVNPGSTLSDFNVQLQTTVNVVALHTYKVSYKLSGDAASTYTLTLMQLNSPWGRVWTQWIWPITTTPTTNTPSSFVCATTETLQLKFLIGQITGSMYLDDVKMLDMTATAVNEINADGIKIFTVEGGLSIEGANKQDYRIVNTLGQVLVKGVCQNDNQFVALDKKGIAIVQINKRAVKVLVN